MKTVVPLIYQHYILKVRGKHGLVFKTRHHSETYLKQVATELIGKGHSTVKVESLLKACRALGIGAEYYTSGE